MKEHRRDSPVGCKPSPHNFSDTHHKLWSLVNLYFGHRDNIRSFITRHNPHIYDQSLYIAKTFEPIVQGEQGTAAELVANAVLKQTNELSF